MASKITVTPKQVVKGVVSLVYTDESGAVVNAQSLTSAQITAQLAAVDAQAAARKADLNSWLTVANA